MGCIDLKVLLEIHNTLLLERTLPLWCLLSHPSEMLGCPQPPHKSIHCSFPWFPMSLLLQLTACGARRWLMSASLTG